MRSRPEVSQRLMKGFSREGGESELSGEQKKKDKLSNLGGQRFCRTGLSMPGDSGKRVRKNQKKMLGCLLSGTGFGGGSKQPSFMLCLMGDGDHRPLSKGWKNTEKEEGGEMGRGTHLGGGMQPPIKGDELWLIFQT